jgi:hypothetical protein
MRFKTTLALIAMLLLGGATLATATAQTPAASPVAPGGTLDVRPLDVEGDRMSFALSPDGQWLAGVGPDQAPCFWDVETLTPQCADEELPILVHPYFSAMAWAPDSSAVAFSLDTPRMAYDSDIYVFERESGVLTNLTDDGYEGALFDGPDDLALDIVPSWSPDGTQIVFSRSLREDDTSSTAIMRIDRGGGEPVEVATLPIEQPLVIWTPMTWLPDDTIVYTISSADVDQPRNGLWRVPVDGDDPVKLVPGDGAADIPAAMAAGVSPKSGAISVYSPLLMAQYTAGFERPIFWLGNLDGGEVTPIPVVEADTGAALDTYPADPASSQKTGLAYPVAPAAISPDGATALLMYRPLDGNVSLATLDIASGEITFLPALPEGTELQPMAPQWADNDTVLLIGPETPLLVTLDRAG